MIKINSKTNQKLLSQFPRDPYANITIQTATQRLFLDLAYLSIDSKFFEQYRSKRKGMLNLSQFPQQSLIKVLRSLYGGQLWANSVQQLTDIYMIIQSLEIDDYKINIMDEIMQKPALKSSLQMLQFSYKFNILFDLFKEFHFEHKLKLLEDNRSYLKLNKISQKALNSILIQYQELVGEQSHQAINNILENFLNRNSIAPADYFQNSQLFTLKDIWEKFHHSIQYIEKIKEEKVKNSTIFSSIESVNSVNKSPSQNDSKNVILDKELRQKDLKIQQLKAENQELWKLLSNFVDTKTIKLSGKLRNYSEQPNKMQTRSNEFYKKVQSINTGICNPIEQRNMKTSLLNNSRSPNKFKNSFPVRALQTHNRIAEIQRNIATQSALRKIHTLSQQQIPKSSIESRQTKSGNRVFSTKKTQNFI